MGKKQIGFLGLGLMGNGMVRNLLSRDFPVIGYDLDGSKVNAIVEMGGQGIVVGWLS